VRNMNHVSSLCDAYPFTKSRTHNPEIVKNCRDLVAFHSSALGGMSLEDRTLISLINIFQCSLREPYALLPSK
jgi:hypothetical protein